MAQQISGPTIPVSLRPPTKPLTIAESREARQPKKAKTRQLTEQEVQTILEQEKQARIEKSVEEIKLEEEFAKQKIAEFQRKINEAKTDSAARSADVALQYWVTYQGTLAGQLNKLQQGQDLSAQDIKSYASARASGVSSSREQRYLAKAEIREQQRKAELQEPKLEIFSEDIPQIELSTRKQFELYKQEQRRKKIAQQRAAEVKLDPGILPGPAPPLAVEPWSTKEKVIVKTAETVREVKETIPKIPGFIRTSGDILTGMEPEVVPQTQEELFAGEFKPGMYEGGTGTYGLVTLGPQGTLMRERVFEEVLPKYQAEVAIKEKADELFNQAVNEINAQIKPGMTQAEVNKLVNEKQKQLEKEIESYSKDVGTLYEEDYKERERQRFVRATKKQLDGKLVTAIKSGARVGLYAVPFYGPALGIADVSAAPGAISETISLYKEYPELRSDIRGTATAGIIGGLAAGGIIGGVKSVRASSRVRAALNESKIKTKFGGTLNEAKVIALKLSPQEEAQLLSALKQNKTIRYVQVKNVAKKGLEKYTPKISGQLVEVLDQQGNVIQRISVGRLSAKLGGKTVSRDVLEQAIGQIKGETGADFYSRTILVEQRLRYNPLKGKFVDDATGMEYTTREATKIVGKTELKRIRLEQSETTTSLIGSRKITEPSAFMKRTLTKEQLKKIGAVDEFGYGIFDDGIIQPRYDKLPKGQLFASAKQKTIIAKKGKPNVVNLISKTDDGAIVVRGKQQKYTITGVGESERIIPRFSYNKEMKPFDLPDEAVTQITKTSKPKTSVKPTKGQGPQLLQEKPQMVGGKGGLRAESVYSSASKIGKMFAYDVGADFSKGIIVRGVGVGAGIGAGVGITAGVSKIGSLSTGGLISPTKGGLIIDTGNISKRKLIDELGNRPLEGFRFSQKPSVTTTTRITPIAQEPPTSIVRTSGTPTITRPIVPSTPTLPPVTPPTVSVPTPNDLKKYAKYEGVGYNVYGKQSKTGKWIKLNKAPNSYTAAMAKGSEAVDTSLSRRFKVEPITVKKTVQGKKQLTPKQFKKKELVQGGQYWFANQNKFRNYSIKKGRKVPLRETFIENAKNALDTRGETQKITIEKRRAQTTRGFFGLGMRQSGLLGKRGKRNKRRFTI